MAQVVFYGKPRCATNQRQRGLLQEPPGDTGIETCLHERGAACAAATAGRD
jgi:hypothetical protein